jgi:hypothetical protein
MKKFLYALAAVALMSTTSCSNEDFPESSPANGDEVTVTFSAGLDAASASRGTVPSDGYTATKLTVVAFNEDGSIADDTTATLALKENEMVGQATLRLLKGRTYNIVFWAQSPDAPYKFSKDKKTISMNYDTKMDANNEDRDAFYKKLSLTVSEATADTQSETVVLKRPLARVSVGTSKADYDAAKKATLPNYSGFKTKVHTTFDFQAGKATDDVAEVDLTPTIYNDPYVLETTFEGTDYCIVCSNYLLVASATTEDADASQATEILDCDFNYGDKSEGEEYSEIETRTFNGVPVAPNCATYILGEFFTKNITHNVKIDPTFDSERPLYINDVAQVLAEGGATTLWEDETVNNNLHVGTKPATLDLNGHTLTINSAYQTTLGANTDLTIKGGTVVYNTDELVVPFVISKGGSLTLDGTELESSSWYAIHPYGDAATVNVINSKVFSSGITIGTNASKVDNWNVVVNIKDSEVHGETGIVFNIPGALNVENSKIYGTRQSLIARGGTINIKDSYFEHEDGLIAPLGAELCWPSYRGKVWSTGNGAPNAAIVVGNRSASSYLYPTDITFDGVTVKNLVLEGYDFPAMYVYANDAASNVTSEEVRVNITYKGTNDFKDAIEYLTKNIYVDGEEVAPNTADTREYAERKNVE